VRSAGVAETPVAPSAGESRVGVPGAPLIFHAAYRYVVALVFVSVWFPPIEKPLLKNPVILSLAAAVAVKYKVEFPRSVLGRNTPTVAPVDLTLNRFGLKLSEVIFCALPVHE